MSPDETQINIFTLNCWQVHLNSESPQGSENDCRGLKYVSRHRSERVQAITRYLENSQFDVIALQELWVYADYDIVRSRLSKCLPFSKFFYRYITAHNLPWTTLLTVSVAAVSSERV
jgi:sphingomyelin phosphodiesterase 2